MARAGDVYYVAEPLNFFRQHETTIRSRMKERETFQEYFRLLFGESHRLDLDTGTRASFRVHMMFLWSAHLIAPSWAGLKNFPYHFNLVRQLEPMALWFLPAGLALRVADLAAKIVRRIGKGGVR